MSWAKVMKPPKQSKCMDRLMDLLIVVGLLSFIWFSVHFFTVTSVSTTNDNQSRATRASVEMSNDIVAVPQALRATLMRMGWQNHTATEETQP
jgi:hypothetical protein